MSHVKGNNMSTKANGCYDRKQLNAMSWAIHLLQNLSVKMSVCATVMLMYYSNQVMDDRCHSKEYSKTREVCKTKTVAFYGNDTIV